jgi:hypothetical protein
MNYTTQQTNWYQMPKPQYNIIIIDCCRNIIIELLF